MKYLKFYKQFESVLSPEIGETLTFVAIYFKTGNGLGFVAIKRDKNDRFIESVECKEGTEITGEVVKISNSNLIKFWRIKLEDGNFIDIYSDRFKVAGTYKTENLKISNQPILAKWSNNFFPDKYPFYGEIYWEATMGDNEIILNYSYNVQYTDKTLYKNIPIRDISFDYFKIMVKKIVDRQDELCNIEISKK